ncbi:MAG TPA: hypothetical protein VGR21_01640 [Cryptosporangiaceae bacterium]|nr:hypothetical protein [Cryptosporangiaceae bacterium]
MDSPFDAPEWPDPESSDPDQADELMASWDEPTLRDDDGYVRDSDPSDLPDESDDGAQVETSPPDLPYAEDVDATSDRAPSLEVDSEPEPANVAALPGDDGELADPTDGPPSRFGTEPDLPVAEDTDRPPLPELDLDRIPEPAGGVPWSDPTILGVGPRAGDPLGGTDDPAGTPVGATTDLMLALGETASGEEATQWATLRDAEDPAVRALARFWAPTQS